MTDSLNDLKVPVGWSIIRANAVLEHINNTIRVQSLKEGIFFHYSIPAIQDTGDGKIEDGIDIDSDKLLLEGGEILISKLNPEKGCVIVAQPHEVPTICSTELVPLRVKNDDHANSKYIFYVYSSNSTRDLLASKSESATRSHKRVNPSEIAKLKFLLPPINAQNQIANYLDRETAHIDALIQAKENLLTMLAEKRQALITQAVTRGLDPNVPLKPSGIDWLGNVPEHWEVKKLKHVTSKIGSGVTPKGGSEVYQKEGIPFLRSQNIHFSGLDLDDVAFITKQVHQSMSNSQVESGDVLLNITGASLGRCYYYEGQYEEANVSQHVCILRPTENILTKYLFYFLYSEIGQLQIQLSQTGGGREGLNFESLKVFVVPLPSLDEQNLVLNFVENESDKFDKLISAAEKTITLLKERRAALITAAVTGQINIPKHHAHNETTNSRASVN